MDGFFNEIFEIMTRYGLMLLLLIVGMNLGYSQMEGKGDSEKMNGVSMVGINGTIDSSHVLPVASIGANWVAAIPFAFMSSATTPELSFDLAWQWKGERVEGVRNYVREFHAKGFSVMIKPQIWIGHGTYTGEMRMNSEEDWLLLEKYYQAYILAFAALAVEENVEMICIGTELKYFVQERPEYWKALIAELRTSYKGKLTYAANWDDFETVSFWGELDYIGVDAYFPVSKTVKTSLKKLIKGWEPHKAIMDSLAKNYERPVLFTEYGYRSIEGCAMKPWDYSEKGKRNEAAQALALKALYAVFWNDENYCGGFLWKWEPNHAKAGGAKDQTFTIQNKKAQHTVRERYAHR